MPGRFVAVGHDGLRVASPDGRTWTDPQLGREGETFNCVAAGGGRVVAAGRFGGDNQIAVTADGEAWQSIKKDAKYSQYIRGIGFGSGGSLGAGTFVAVGGDPGSVGGGKPFSLLSTDGLDWGDYRPDEGGKFVLRRLAFGDGRFVGVGDRGRRATSADGVTWTDLPSPKAVDTLVDVAFGAGVFVGVGLHGLRMTTTDGLEWADRQTGPEGEHLNSVVWTGTAFVAVGQGATYRSADGRAWERLPNSKAPTIACFGDGVFVGAAWKGRLFRSVDGVAWEEVHRAVRHVEAVAYAES